LIQVQSQRRWLLAIAITRCRKHGKKHPGYTALLYGLAPIYYGVLIESAVKNDFTGDLSYKFDRSSEHRGERGQRVNVDA
jgi:hypothetical protein